MTWHHAWPCTTYLPTIDQLVDWLTAGQIVLHACLCMYVCTRSQYGMYVHITSTGICTLPIWLGLILSSPYDYRIPRLLVTDRFSLIPYPVYSNTAYMYYILKLCVNRSIVGQADFESESAVEAPPSPQRSTSAPTSTTPTATPSRDADYEYVAI